MAGLPHPRHKNAVQPQIFVTGVTEDNSSDYSASNSVASKSSSTKSNGLMEVQKKASSESHPQPFQYLATAPLVPPAIQTGGRRPSFLPNNTEQLMRPQLRKFSSYDLSLNDTIGEDSSFPGRSPDDDDNVDGLEPSLEDSAFWRRVGGDVQYVTDYLDMWHICSRMMPLKTLNAFLRTLGSPLLINNPFSGIFIATALGIQDPLLLLGGIAGLSCALLTALLLQQPQHIVSSGQVTHHALLLGVLMAHGWRQNSDGHHPGVLVGLLFLSSIISVFLANAVATWLSQSNLPALTVSYTILAAALLVLLDLPERARPEVQGPVSNASREIHWTLVTQAMLRSMGQVFGCSGIPASALVLVALFLFSPTALVQGFVGSVVSTLCGTLLDAPPYTLLYSGLFGRQGVLVGVSLGGFFFVLNLYSSLASVVGAATAALLTAALGRVRFPIVTIPHLVTTLLLLNARIRGGLLKRVDLVYLTYPEMHRRLFHPANSVEDCH